MKKSAIVAGLLLVLIGASAARAAEIDVVSTTTVNLRAGPAVSFPAVSYIPAGSHLVLYGCVAGYSWCDISWGRERGWVAATYLTTLYRSAPIPITGIAAARIGIRVVAFDAGYWQRYYVGRPWYPRRRYYGVW
ncbi:MAG TPA: SH3 domain-containing protein [Devosiaceae bacterium]